jgi:inositol hexakisphosphate/diphosphoinositol-pentakisphosphate kinase
VAIFRHGDRTPKQKMKMRVTHLLYTKFYLDNVPETGKELKVKSVRLME